MCRKHSNQRGPIHNIFSQVTTIQLTFPYTEHKHSYATADMIATKCGFRNDSLFNRPETGNSAMKSSEVESVDTRIRRTLDNNERLTRMIILTPVHCQVITHDYGTYSKDGIEQRLQLF
jgi:hypothetical protein